MKLADAPHRAHRHAGRVLPRRSLAHGARDKIIEDFQNGEGPGALVLSLKAGGTGLNLTAANHVVLYDRWWNPAVEDQARDRAWRIGQTHTVIAHRLVCPGTVDERVEEVVEGKRRIADLVLPEVELAGRPRPDPAEHGARHPARRRAHRGRDEPRPGRHRHRRGGRGVSESSGGNRRRRSRSGARRKGSARPFWGNAETAAGPEHSIEPVDHPTALIDSLGAPPFPRADAAPHYFAAVYTARPAWPSRSPTPTASSSPMTRKPSTPTTGTEGLSPLPAPRRPRRAGCGRRAPRRAGGGRGSPAGPCPGSPRAPARAARSRAGRGGWSARRAPAC